MLDNSIRKEKIVTVQIQQDFDACERAGAGGMFQVISITFVYEDGTEDYHTDLIDQGDMFYNTDEVLEKLALSSHTINVERV